ncbi:GATA transcription factor 4-like [Bidens hawaiensis]|uniref:GATA transcription factor 4-like n=1 Tax=Bidens hawaiensis TaxID=980011 RepID=UPI00404B0E8B
MDIYGMSCCSQDFSGVDGLLNFSNDQTDLICASATDMTYQHHNITSSSTHYQYGGSSSGNSNNDNDIIANYHNHMTDFTDGLCVPSNDVAELEWLSNFVHDSFNDFPSNNIIGTINYRPENTSFHSRSRTKRTRMPTNNTSWTSMSSYTSPTSSCSYTKSEAKVVRRCTHCASEKTPQWRTGPLGPKTLCNACGVRYKSGRLVPEYRPAASPTFVLTQHSNSHRKVMELRRQKEVIIGRQQQQQQPSPASKYQMYGHRNRNNYEVC